jgi:glutathione S-transferase
MITIHHLGVSQSERIVWLMEELGLPYQLRWYNRSPEGPAPEEYLALHPVATAPVIEDDGRMLAESTAIVEYICQRYGGGRLTVKPEAANYPDYLYWLQFNNNVLGLLFAKGVLRESAAAPGMVGQLVRRREDSYYRFLEQRLGESPYLAGPELTCADIMSVFQLTTCIRYGARKIDKLPNTQAYVRRIAERPAYQRAMQIAGPDASPPSA